MAGEGAGEVHVEHAAPGLGVHVADDLAADDARVVDEHVEPAGPVDREPDRRVPGGGVGHVEGEEARRAALRRQPDRERLALDREHVADHDRALTLSAAGDDRGLAGQVGERVSREVDGHASTMR